jgi:hypothetical protein
MLRKLLGLDPEEPIKFTGTPSAPNKNPSQLNISDVAKDDRVAAFEYELKQSKQKLSPSDVQSLSNKLIDSDQPKAFNVLAKIFPTEVTGQKLATTQVSNHFLFTLGAKQEDNTIAPSLKNFPIFPAENPEAITRHTGYLKTSLTQTWPQFYAVQQGGRDDGESTITKVNHDKNGSLTSKSRKSTASRY